jgi:hypothetical protein
MPAGLYNFSIEQGTSFGLTIQYADSGNVPIDLAAFSCARMQWITNTNETLDFTTNNTNNSLYYFSLEVPSSGIISFKLPASITGGYNFLSANYDLELETVAEFYTNGGPQVIRLLEGSINIIPEITKMTCTGA